MEMKLDERALKFLADIAATEDKEPFASCMKHECIDAQITQLLQDYEKELEGVPDCLKNCFKFVKTESIVQTDGRSCPGDERKARLAKLSNGEWRKDHWTIMNGIACHVVRLNHNDAIKLS